MKAPAFNGGALDNGAIRCIEAIDPGREESLQARRKDNRSIAGLRVRIEREQLFDEQGVALGRVSDTGACLRREIVCRQAFNQGSCIAFGDRLQRNHERVLPGHRPRRARLQEVGAC